MCVWAAACVGRDSVSSLPAHYKNMENSTSVLSVGTCPGCALGPFILYLLLSLAMAIMIIMSSWPFYIFVKRHQTTSKLPRELTVYNTRCVHANCNLPLIVASSTWPHSHSSVQRCFTVSYIHY